MHPFRNVPNAVVYNETLQREAEIRRAGYELEVVYEHQIRASMIEDLEFRNFMKQNKRNSTLVARNGYYGGRTQVCPEKKWSSTCILVFPHVLQS